MRWTYAILFLLIVCYSTYLDVFFGWRVISYIVEFLSEIALIAFIIMTNGTRGNTIQ